MMADFALALRGMLPVGCTHPGIRAVWVLSATLFPDTEGDVLERPEETKMGGQLNNSDRGFLDEQRNELGEPSALRW